MGSRRGFLKAMVASPFVFQAWNASAVNAQEEVRGFSGFIENMNVELYQDAAEAYMQAAVDMGANHVLLLPRYDYRYQNGGIKPKDDHTHVEYAFDLYAETATSKGLNVCPLFGAFGDLRDRPSSSEIQQYLDEYAEYSLRYAEKANQLDAPFFSPFGEFELVFRWNRELARRATGLINEWFKEFVPQLRTKFHGRLIPVVTWTYEDIPEAEDVPPVSVVKMIDFSHFDGLGVELYPRGAWNSQAYGDRIDQMISETTAFAQSKGISQIMVTECGAPVGGDLRTNHPVNYSNAPIIITESIQAECTREILDHTNGKVEGLFFWGVDKVWHPFSVIGRPAGELVQQAWGGHGPNGHADTAPSITRTDMWTGVNDLGHDGLKYFGMHVLFWVSDISGPSDVDSVTIVGADGGNLDSVLRDRQTKRWSHFESYDINGGEPFPAFMFPEVKARLRDKRGNERTKVAVPSEYMPNATPRYTGNVQDNMIRVSRNGNISFTVPADEYGMPMDITGIHFRIFNDMSQLIGEYHSSDPGLRKIAVSDLNADINVGKRYWVQLGIETERAHLVHLPDGSDFNCKVLRRGVVRAFEFF